MSLLLRSLTRQLIPCSTFFFFNDTATTEIYTLSLHDALPISNGDASVSSASQVTAPPPGIAVAPNVQVAPAGTVGAEVEEADSPRQSFPGAGAEVHGRLLTCSSFWSARNVAAEV